MDKQPLMLCASTGTSLPGEQKVRYRHKLVRGELVKTTYTLDQPDMHAQYRKYFNAVDKFNKAALQPGTLSDVWRTKKAHRRLFAATWAWVETNAQLAYNKYNPATKLTKREWYLALSDACLNNPFCPPRPRLQPVSSVHTALQKSSQGRCCLCTRKTGWKCGCGRPFCGNVTRAKQRGGGEGRAQGVLQGSPGCPKGGGRGP